MPAPWPGKRKAAMFRRQLWWVSVAPFNDCLPLWGPTSQSYKKVASSRRADCYWSLYGLGERGWTRTIDPCLKRALLCQLSYAPTVGCLFVIVLENCEFSEMGPRSSARRTKQNRSSI